VVDPNIEEAISKALPAEFHAQAHEIASVLTNVRNKTISPQEAQIYFEKQKNLLSVLYLLANQTKNTYDGIITFGNGTQSGDITIQDVAGGNIIKIGALSLNNTGVAYQQICPSPSCSAINLPNLKFCARCGSTIMRSCPVCNKETSLISSGICITCGVHYDFASYRIEIQKMIARVSHSINNAAKEIRSVEQEISSQPPPVIRSSRSQIWYGFTYVSLILGVVLFVIFLTDQLVGFIILAAALFVCTIILGITARKEEMVERKILSMELYQQRKPLRNKIYQIKANETRLQEELKRLHGLYKTTEAKIRKR